ncbi:coiled-coil domain-containing protein 124 [Procambarus clarkii]|uniref:coiled-coil domain-containing protein 124 n=1 Tax=Procambarus clarkii TaxID=6728 RepID=UPI001E67161E|nr:coiled-coil domain-containing protein 124-like [Procambarus clarkii]XP_045595123.1 coiled-coil domain-containing protein 124-like [Procambarus clarkii]
MPKKFQGENSKAAVAKARKAEAAAQEKLKKDKAEEEAFWDDDDKQIKKKLARKEDRDKKRQAELERKAQNRALAEDEVAEIVPKLPPQKVTAYQLQKNREKQEAEKESIETHLDVPLVENLNRDTDEIVSASGIDAALSALSVPDDSTDRHPERRMAAAFKAFESVRLPQIKKENPNLRLSQLKQMLRKEWQKSPENPLNKRQLE